MITPIVTPDELDEALHDSSRVVEYFSTSKNRWVLSRLFPGSPYDMLCAQMHNHRYRSQSAVLCTTPEQLRAGVLAKPRTLQCRVKEGRNHWQASLLTEATAVPLQNERHLAQLLEIREYRYIPDAMPEQEAGVTFQTLHND